MPSNCLDSSSGFNEGFGVEGVGLWGFVNLALGVWNWSSQPRHSATVAPLKTWRRDPWAEFQNRKQKGFISTTLMELGLGFRV